MRRKESELNKELTILHSELAQIKEENLILKQTGGEVTTLQEQLKAEKERFKFFLSSDDLKTSQDCCFLYSVISIMWQYNIGLIYCM
jgi:hypothetical protein